MREILFRGKRVDSGEWVEGCFVAYKGVKNESYIFEPSEVEKGLDLGGYLDCCKMTEVIPESVGQYTGLTDKNDKKIFEGDIILWGLAPCVAKYDTENARFMFYENGKYLKNGFNKDTMEMKEVIGNIHDNPGLLNKKVDNLS